MKQSIIYKLFLVFALSASLSGCGDESKSIGNSNITTDPVIIGEGFQGSQKIFGDLHVSNQSLYQSYLNTFGYCVLPPILNADRDCQYYDDRAYIEITSDNIAAPTSISLKIHLIKGGNNDSVHISYMKIADSSGSLTSTSSDGSPIFSFNGLNGGTFDVRLIDIGHPSSLRVQVSHASGQFQGLFFDGYLSK